MQLGSLARRSRIVSAVLVLTIIYGMAACQEPPATEQALTVYALGRNYSMGSFNYIHGRPSEKHVYWYLDWRTDGCSEGPTFWRGVFYDACRRHDFNWKNNYELDYYFTGVDVWNVSRRHSYDDQFGTDLSHICDGGFECNLNAHLFKAGVMAVPISWICYDHYNYSQHEGHKLVQEHPDQSCT